MALASSTATIRRGTASRSPSRSRRPSSSAASPSRASWMPGDVAAVGDRGQGLCPQVANPLGVQDQGVGALVEELGGQGAQHGGAAAAAGGADQDVRQQVFTTLLPGAALLSVPPLPRVRIGSATLFVMKPSFDSQPPLALCRLSTPISSVTFIGPGRSRSALPGRAPRGPSCRPLRARSPTQATRRRDRRHE